MLTFELNKASEQLEIHGDKEGILKLAKILTNMAEQKESEHKTGSGCNGANFKNKYNRYQHRINETRFNLAYVVFRLKNLQT